jgi:hypothetical protein
VARLHRRRVSTSPHFCLFLFFLRLILFKINQVRREWCPYPIVNPDHVGDR